MKQIIKGVLDDMSESQINLGSSAARETVAGLISATLNDRGRWIEFDEQTLNGQRADGRTLDKVRDIDIELINRYIDQRNKDIYRQR